MTGLFALLTGLLYGWLLHLNWQRERERKTWAWLDNLECQCEPPSLKLPCRVREPEGLRATVVGGPWCAAELSDIYMLKDQPTTTWPMSEEEKRQSLPPFE